MNDSWGKTKFETNLSKCGFSCTQVDLGLTLKIEHDDLQSKRSIRHKRRRVPLSEELENVVLALTRKPLLARYKEVDLTEVDAQDLRRKVFNEVLGEIDILSLKGRGHL